MNEIVNVPLFMEKHFCYLEFRAHRIIIRMFVQRPDYYQLFDRKINRKTNTIVPENEKIRLHLRTSSIVKF